MICLAWEGAALAMICLSWEGAWEGRTRFRPRVAAR